MFNPTTSGTTGFVLYVTDGCHYSKATTTVNAVCPLLTPVAHASSPTVVSGKSVTLDG